MKNLLALSVLFTLTVFNSFAQDWTFINPNERYHFQHVDDTIPMNTVLVDSLTSNDSITTYHLNRLFLPCDTCEPYIGDGNVEYDVFLDNQPTFLQREVKYYQVSRTVELKNPEKYTLQLPGNPVLEWWFDEAKTKKATVHEFGEFDVFGTKDSVVTYAIDGEPQIKLSKTYGFIKYFDYELKGLENAELGETLPIWKDFYDFEVGDVFQYFKDFYPGGDLPGGWLYEKYEIEQIIKTDSITYIYRDGIIGYTYGTNEIVEFEQVKDTIIIDITNSHYPDELLFVEENTVPIIGNIPVYTTPKYLINNDTISLLIGEELLYTGIVESNLFLKNSNNTYFNDSGYDSFLFLYKPKLGHVLTIGREGRNFGSYRNELIGFVKGSDTTGVVYPDELFTIPDDTTGLIINKKLDIVLAPNPSTGQLTIDLATETNACVEVYNLQGQLIESFITENNQVNNLSHLKAGIYIISVETKQGIQQVKWIKQ